MNTFSLYNALNSLPIDLQDTIYEMSNIEETIEKAVKTQFKHTVLPQIDKSIVFLSNKCYCCYDRVIMMKCYNDVPNVDTLYDRPCALCGQRVIGDVMVSVNDVDIREGKEFASKILEGNDTYLGFTLGLGYGYVRSYRNAFLQEQEIWHELDEMQKFAVMEEYERFIITNKDIDSDDESEYGDECGSLYNGMYGSEYGGEYGVCDDDYAMW